MRETTSFALLSILSLAAAGCGSSATPSPGTTDPSSPDTELFVRRGAAGLEVVEVDLESGAATPVAGAIPGTGSADAVVRQITRAGDRLLVSTSITGALDSYATYALDRAGSTWRDLHVTSYNPVYSADLGLIVEGGPQSQTLPNRVRLVTYDGRTLFEVVGQPGADRRYPRLEALSPAGTWFAVRSGPEAIDVREIADGVPPGPVRQLPKAEPPDTYTTTIACALPTTMIVESQAPKTSWVDRTLAPVDAQGFSADSNTLPYELSQSGRKRVCSYQVSTGEAHDVYAFGDRSLTKLFSFAGKDTRLLAVGPEVHLRSAALPGLATLARNDGPELTTYTPLPEAPSSLAGTAMDSAHPSVHPLATSLSAANKALVFSVQYDKSSGDYVQTTEIDEDLVIVNADGSVRPTLRLRAERDPSARNAAGFTVPTYRFTRDGKKLVYVKDGRIHVRAIDGDATVDRLVGAATFVDSAVLEAAAP
jgi:hypothetical protein